MKIFLSHLNIERKLAELFQTTITRDFIGLTQFFVSSDRTTILPGDKWFPRLIEGLEKSDLHLVLCSPKSVERPWINFETGAAYIRHVRIIPICHSGLSPQQLPFPMSELESVSASDLEGLRKLYSGIASILESAIPDAKLKDLADQIKAFEEGYQDQLAVSAERESAQTSIVTIRSPQVLCVTSKQFLGLRQDHFDIIQKAFPETTTHQRELTSQSVRDALMNRSFDIVHVSTYVCPKTGDLIFSDVDLSNPVEETSQSGDCLTADAFVELIKTHTKLVVIASCESDELATKLLSEADVIATRDRISANMLAAWIENFYQALQVKTLSEAFDFAVKASRAPMNIFYSKHDLRIELDKKGSNYRTN